MLKAITIEDELECIDSEQSKDDAMLELSCRVDYANLDIPLEIEANTHEIFRKILADTQEEHLRDADIAGLSYITLESLQHFRGHIRDKKFEDVHLLFQLTWIHSTLRLARALDLDF